MAPTVSYQRNGGNAGYTPALPRTFPSQTKETTMVTKLEIVPDAAPKADAAVTPPDIGDISDLWLDPGLGDGLTNTVYLTIPVDKPKDFFRVCPLDDYRRRTEIYTHKVENVIDAVTYLVAPNMRGKVDKARLATIVVAIYRDGSVRLWPIPSPAAGEKDNGAWISARSAARAAMDRWIKLVWVRGAYQMRDALPGYAPDPDWSKLPSFDELAKLAFGEGGIIRDANHPIVRELMGAPPAKPDDGNGVDL
jgi:hypothetical protein